MICVFFLLVILFIVLIIIRNDLVYTTGMRAIVESHPKAYGGGHQYTKDMWALHKWTYKQFYKD